ncbi:hypothetical protein CesoFtcFv8_003372 [Champsocephalus esox]|uniref:Uncharacterized protein n=1 Tax=Champsocephalus esox TaxID=159716 RepID=A0AAN8HBF0_9TELE|nr:hypothetical protein CesoFtcFv8_003372 [Champsocephalus esox]
MVHKSFLKVKEGHFVAVKRISGAGLELCVVELKNQASSVKIWRREKETKNQIAFSFLRDGDDYSPKVKEKELQLERIADVSGHEPYWFEKVDLKINEHYGLRSVVNGHYLSQLEDGTKETTVFCLSEDSQACAELTDELTEEA